MAKNTHHMNLIDFVRDHPNALVIRGGLTHFDMHLSWHESHRGGMEKPDVFSRPGSLDQALAAALRYEYSVK